MWAWRPPWVWAWRLPRGVGLETPPGQTHQLPPWVWAWRPPQARPPQARPLNFPLGCSTWRTARHVGISPPPPWIPARHAGISPPAMHAGIPPWTEFLTHTSENITLPQTSFAGGKNSIHRSCHLPKFWSKKPKANTKVTLSGQ